MKLSVVILTFNSQKYLDEVLQSTAFADEVLILDSGSQDDTLAIAKRYGARIERQSWLGFGPQKQRAVDLASHDWVFVLDSDEVISPILAQEIRSILQTPHFYGYTVPRLNWFFGKPIRHGGLYPDRTLRLFHRAKGRFSDDAVHERVLLDGEPGALKNPMKHYAYETIEQFIAKQSRYAMLGRRPNRLKAVVNPLWAFLRMYVIKCGFLDGWHGFVIARLYAQYTFWKYAQ